MNAEELLTHKQTHEYLALRLEGYRGIDVCWSTDVVAAEVMRILLDACEEVVLTYEPQDEFSPNDWLRGVWG